MKRINQRGFGVVELLVVLIFIAGVATLGWYIFKNRESTPPVSTTVKQDKPEQSQPKVVAGILKIPEWNIQITADPYLKDLSYRIKNNTTLHFVSSLDSGALKDSCIKTSYWGLTRVYGEDPSYFNGDTGSNVAMKDSPYLADAMANKQVVKVGDYYYLKIYPQSGCDDESDNIGSAIDAAVGKMLQSAEALQ